MMNEEQIKSVVQERILSSALCDEVSGVVKKDRRPTGSTKEDVIISCLASENGNIQRSTINVNIYVADKEAGYQHDPDHARLNVLATMSQEVLDTFRGDGWRAVLKSQRITSVGEREHVITNKIDLRILNEEHYG